MDQKLPFTIKEMSEEEVGRREAVGIIKHTNAVRTDPGNVILPLNYPSVASVNYNFKFRSDDVVVLSYPKSGTIWTTEVVWCLKNLDRLHLADQQLLGSRTFFLETDLLMPNKTHAEVPGEECGEAQEDRSVSKLAAAHQGSPRVISSHLHFYHLNPDLLNTCKVVYVVRNPKDVCFSYYNFMFAREAVSCDLTTFAQLFMEDQILYGSYWGHLKQAWQLRTHPNLHIIFYEDMKADPMVELNKLSHFLGLDLSQQQLQSVVETTSLEKMKAREKKLPIAPLKEGHTFFPGGQVGRWATAVSPHLAAKMDAWITDNSRDIDINLKYQ